jgi:hypothetical protein
MRDANSWPDLISRYFRRSRTSFGKWFNNIPNLAASDKSLPHDINHGTGQVAEPEQRYHDLLVRLQRSHSGAPLGRDRPRSAQQLQEAVNDIVRQGKEKMANAHSKDEILLEFIDSLYKIKSLL